MNPKVIILGTQIITAFPAGFTIGSQTLAPGGTITYSGDTLTLESSGEVIIHSSDYSATLTLPPSVKITPPPQTSGAAGVIFASRIMTAFQNTDSITAVTEGTLTQSYTKLTYTGSQWQNFTGTTTFTSAIETTDNGQMSTKTLSIVVGPTGVHWRCVGPCIVGVGWHCV